MSAPNNTKFQPAVFFLTGILGHEDVHIWISIPFSIIYFTSILGNSVIFFITIIDPTLQEPMYVFLSMLAITDLGLSISTMPTTLGIFWFNSREISHDACFAQLFFINALQITESSILLLMAIDRLVAICNPLRYASLLTPPRIARMVLLALLRIFPIMVPLPIVLKQHYYCKTNILAHSYCLHHDVMRLACSDIRVNVIFGLFGFLCSVVLDFLLILLSYIMIFKTVLSIASPAERFKSLDTCMSHVCIVLFFYLPAIALSLIYRFVKISSPLVQIVMGYVYLLIPPLMNPIVYSVKNKHLRMRLIRVFVNRRVSSSPVPQIRLR